MAREMKGESGAMQTWLETSITGLHALVGRIQVYGWFECWQYEQQSGG